MSVVSKTLVLKIVVGGTTLIGLGAAKMLWNMRPQKVSLQAQVDFERFMGTWYEVARKPISIERRSFKNIQVEYANRVGNKFSVVLHYLSKEGRLGQLNGDARIIDSKDHNEFTIYYLPSFLRKFKKLRYGIIRIDADYQVALIGNAQRTHLRLLSRTPTLDARIVDDFLTYAKEQGYELNDLIYVVHDIQ